jgi:hypothetical protein
MLKNSFLKTNIGPNSGGPVQTSSSTKPSTVDQMKDVLIHTADWLVATETYRT